MTRKIQKQGAMKIGAPKSPPFQADTKYIRVTDPKEMRRLVQALMFRAPWYMVIREALPTPGKAPRWGWQVQFPSVTDIEVLAATFDFEEVGK